MFTDSFVGTYVACRFSEETLDEIQRIQEELRLPNPTPREDLHSTIIYSRTNVPFIPDDSPELIAEGGVIRKFEGPKKNYIVLAMNSPYLQKRHQYGNILGATYDFDEYIPHITLADDVGVLEYEGEFTFPIYSSHEYVEELRPD